jgi:hypothetical protein
MGGRFCGDMTALGTPVDAAWHSARKFGTIKTETKTKPVAATPTA